MESFSIRRVVFVGVALGIVISCDTSLEQPGDSSGDGGPGAPAEVVNSFSNANVSPPGPEQPGEEPPSLEESGEETLSFFRAFQIDPTAEDSAGPVLVASADMDKDGLPDLVSAWNQSQPIQLHLQRRDEDDNISFRSITLAGTSPIAVVAGIEIGQLNDDNGDGRIDDQDWPDMVVLVKATASVGLCPKNDGGATAYTILEGEIVVLFSPGNDVEIANGDRWTQTMMVNPIIAPPIWVHNQYPGLEVGSLKEMAATPELGGFTSLVVADIDGENGDDILVALNPGVCENLGQSPPINTVDLWVNPGPGRSTTPAAWGTPVTIMADLPQVRDLAVMDIDSDGDLDVIATYTNSISRNIRWARSPLVPHEPGGPSGPAQVVAGGLDFTDICAGGANPGSPCSEDADCLGAPDGTCSGGSCLGGVNPGAICTNDADCLGVIDGVCAPGFGRLMASGWEQRPIGTLDTGADVMTIADVDADGADDVVVRSTNGRIIQWFRRPTFEAVEPEFPPPDPVPDRFNFPWQVYTLSEFSERVPGGLTVGDIDNDNRIEIILAAEGAVLWFDESTVLTPYDPWIENTIIQDVPAESSPPSLPGTPPPPGGGQPAPGGSGVGVTQVDVTTSINGLLVVDLDGDGFNDIVGTLNRRSGAGLSDDRLVWYRNTLGDE